MKKIFSKHLYKEALRQGLAIGIIFTALFLMFSVIQCIGSFNDIQMAETIPEYDRILTIDGSNFNVLYMLAFYVMAPLLIFNAFNFLTQRSRSDFYHSIPHTRVCLYLSTLTGALTWMLIAVAVPALFSLPIYYLMSASSSFLYVNLASILLLLFNTLAACLVTAGVATIAVSITGMYFPCVIVFGLILFLPKVLLFIFTHQICSFLPFMTTHSFGIFGSLRYSIPADILLSSLTSNDISWWDSSIGAGIYSLCFGILLMGLGLLLFQKRKSEAAGQSAPNTVLQHIYRTAVGLAVSLLPLMLLINDGFSLAILFLYGLAVIACFAYELITTRKLRNLKRATVSIAALVLLNIMIFVGIFASCQILKGKKIEVAGFRNSEQLVEISTDTPTYEGLMIKDIVIDDAAICKMVEDAYNRTVANGSTMGSYSYSRYYYSNIQLISKTGGKFYRKIAFTQEEYAKIHSYLSTNAHYKENYIKMPQAPESFTANCVGNREYDQKIYETLLNEVKNFSFEQWQSLLGTGNMQEIAAEEQKYTQDGISFIEPASIPVYVSGALGTVTYQSKYMASKSLTPDTYGLILFYKNKKNYNQAETFFQQFNTYMQISLTMNLSNTPASQQQYLSLDKYDDGSLSVYCNEESFSTKPGTLSDTLLPSLITRLRTAAETQGEIDLAMPILELGINAYNYNTNASVNTNFYINITSEEFEVLKQEILSKTH